MHFLVHRVREHTAVPYVDIAEIDIEMVSSRVMLVHASCMELSSDLHAQTTITQYSKAPVLRREPQSCWHLLGSVLRHKRSDRPDRRNDRRCGETRRQERCQAQDEKPHRYLFPIESHS